MTNDNTQQPQNTYEILKVTNHNQMWGKPFGEYLITVKTSQGQEIELDVRYKTTGSYESEGFYLEEFPIVLLNNLRKHNPSVEYMVDYFLPLLTNQDGQ